MEEDLHGPHFDARGASFPGVNLMVQLGHGRDYAWSATTATSDNVDTFAEVLCQDDVHYLYKGQCRRDGQARAHELVDAERERPDAAGLRDADRVPDGARHRLRARHRRRQEGRVRLARARRTSTRPTARSGSSTSTTRRRCTTRSRSARRSTASTSSSTGATSTPTTSPTSCRGWLPAAREAHVAGLPGARHRRVRLAGLRPRPAHDEDGAAGPRGRTRSTSRYLVSWNNKQAPGWAAADDKFSYGPIFRSQMIERRVQSAIKGARKATIEQLVQAMEEPASQDLRAWSLMPILRKALGKPKDQRCATRSRCCRTGPPPARTGATSTRTARTRTSRRSR